MPLETAVTAWPGPAGAQAGLVAEALLGYPAALHRRLPHPVVGLGGAISALERRWNQPERSEAQRRWLGVVTIALVAGGAGLAGWLLQRLCASLPVGLAAFALIASSMPIISTTNTRSGAISCARGGGKAWSGNGRKIPKEDAQRGCLKGHLTRWTLLL